MGNEKELEVLMEDSFRDLYKYLDVKFKEVHDNFDKVFNNLDKVQNTINKVHNNDVEFVKLLHKVDKNLER